MQFPSVHDTQNRRLSYAPARPRRWNDENASLVGSAVYEVNGNLPPCRERGKITERVSYRQRRTYALIATDANLSGKRAEKWLCMWDKGGTEMRRNILEAFIYLHHDSNAATIESDLGSAASLLFTRFTSWMRLSYKTLHSGRGATNGRSAASFETKSTQSTGTASLRSAVGKNVFEKRISHPFSGTGTASMPRVSGAAAPNRGLPLRAPQSFGAGGQEGVVAERERRLEEGSYDGDRLPPTKATPAESAPPHSFPRGRTPTPTTVAVLDGPRHAMEESTGKGREGEVGRKKPLWSENPAGKTSDTEASKDTEDSPRSVLLLLLQAIIIFMRGAAFMTQFVEAGVASMLADCLECGTQSCPLLEEALVTPSPYRILSKTERKHVVLLLLYLANAGRVYRELIGDEASMVKLFHALQREKDEDIAILLTELFTSLGQGHPRMAPMIHSGLIRVILCHSFASERTTLTVPSLSPPPPVVSSSFSSPSSFRAAVPSAKATLEAGKEEEEERQESRTHLSLPTPLQRVRPLSEDSEKHVEPPPPAGDAPLLSPLERMEGNRGGPPHRVGTAHIDGTATGGRRPSLGVTRTASPSTTTTTTTPSVSPANPMARSGETSMQLPSLPLLHKDHENLSSSSSHRLHPSSPLPPSLTSGQEWLERTISDCIAFHTARTLHALQITMEEHHYALCQKGGGGVPGVSTSMDLVPIVGLTLSGLEDWKRSPFQSSGREAKKRGWWRGRQEGAASAIVPVMEEGEPEGWSAGRSPLCHPEEGIHPLLKALTFSEFLDAFMYLTLHENTRFRVEGSELLALAAKNIQYTRPILTRCFEMIDDDMFCITDEEDKVRIACRQRRQLSCGRAAVQILLSKPMSEERKTLIIQYIALYGAHISLLKYLRLSDSSDAAAVHDCCKALQLIARASHAQQQAELQQTQQHPSRWICAEPESRGEKDSPDGQKEEGEGSTGGFYSVGTKTSTSPVPGGAHSPVLQMGFVIHETVGDHLYQVLLHEELSEEESFAILGAAKSRRVMIPLSTEGISNL